MAEGAVIGAAAGLGLWVVHVVSALVFPWPIQLVGAVFPLYFVPVAILLHLAVGFFVAWRNTDHELRSLHGVLAVLSAGLLLPVAAFTARDHFACVRWGTGHQACELVPSPAMVSITATIVAWTAALALLLLPTWTALRDGARRAGPSQQLPIHHPPGWRAGSSDDCPTGDCNRWTTTVRAHGRRPEPAQLQDPLPRFGMDMPAHTLIPGRIFTTGEGSLSVSSPTPHLLLSRSSGLDMESLNRCAYPTPVGAWAGAESP
ncbi:hypothetical protein ACU639_23260 [Streptomyces cynarae]|uniref:hypothetical protein n=1 Tax=Streptomyces cynarae TaxID=2981134 RepID=UPI00406CBB7C